MRRTAMAVWEGDLKRGKGVVSTESGAVRSVGYNFSKRFEQEPGTNPEELLGAALASCFSMALGSALAGNGTTATQIETVATVNLEPKDGGFSVTRIDLSCHASAPGCTDEQFDTIATNTKSTCPISRTLSVPITLHAHLV